MTTSLFEISHSESFLLGLVLGEWDVIGWDNFDDILLERLNPFVPDFKKYQQHFLDELPTDAVPIHNDPGQPESYTSLQFNFIIQLESKKWFAVKYDDSRHSLLDLVNDRLKDFRPFGWDQRSSQYSHLESRSDGIEDSLRALARDNHCEIPFSTGRAFGNLFGLFRKAQMIIEDLQIHIEANEPLNSCELPTAAVFEGKRIDFLKKLSKDSLVLRVKPANSILTSEIERWNREYRHIAMNALPVQASEPEVLKEMNYSLQTYWLCVGVVYHHLHDIDDAAKLSTPLPRGFQIIGERPLDAMRFNLDVAQRELLETSSRYCPAEIVKVLVAGIEPMARELTSQFDKEKKANHVFHLLKNDQRKEAKSFSMIASPIHEKYRNTLLHNGPRLNDPVQNWTEALYVYAGCKLLVELYDALKRSEGPLAE